MATLEDITIGVSSFIRHKYLTECLRRIQANLPECQVIVVDDSDFAPLTPPGVKLIKLPFDSGLPAKRNASVAACETRYWYCGCDDYDHGTPEFRDGLKRLLKVLEENPEYTVAGGRFENTPYEGYLTYVPGSHIKETRLVPDGREFIPCDLTANVFLARTDDIRDIPWDERMKIGGEHGDWFLELKMRGRQVAWVEDVNINSLRLPEPGSTDIRYGQFRARAADLGHKVFLQKRNIRVYRGFND